MLARRTFIKTLFSLPALAVALPAPAQPPALRLPLLGLDRHQGRALWPVFAVGDPLRLALPRDQALTPGIAVYWGDFLIGHLSRKECEGLRACVQRGELQATIAALREPARAMMVGVWRGI